MIGKLDEALRFHQTALSLRSERQQVLASNIANADTPNYKARDVDFNAALKQALGPGATPTVPAAAASSSAGGAAKPAMNSLAVALARTSAAHLSGNAGAATATASGAQLMYRQTAVQGNVDGNTVDMDVERNQFADNALRYEAGVTFASGQIKTLLTAVTGQ